MKKLTDLFKIIENNQVSSDIQIFLASKVAGDDYDDYRKNFTEVLLNPITIKGYVREVSPEALVWKQYGLSNIGAKEILCREQYKSYFQNCSKIVIDGDTYQVYKEGTGGKVLISKRPFGVIRVVITRKE